MPSPLQIRPHPTKGRTLHATQPFQLGKTILSFTPLLLLPDIQHLTTICTYCLRPGSPRACSRCHAAYYCDSSCQAAAWSVVHSRECKALREHIKDEDQRRALPTQARALIQALLCKEIEEGLRDLEGHVLERRAEPKWQDFVLIAKAACKYAGKGTGEQTVKRAIELLCKIQTNSFQRYDTKLGPIGIFLEPTLSMANHSCIPNAMVQFVGRNAILVAENPIQTGDEIEISYTFYTDPLSARREALSHYKFECQCPRCKDDLNVYQVCAIFPGIGSNSLSPVTDLTRLREHPATSIPSKQSSAKLHCKTANHLDSLDTIDSIPEQRRLLQRYYNDCAGLVKEDLWAITPLSEIVHSITGFYCREENPPFALVTSCFLVTACNAYQYPSPAYPPRLDGVFRIINALTHTAFVTASLSGSVKTVTTKATLDQKIQETLQGIDQVSLCQMLAILLLKWTPDESSALEPRAVTAREMLDDIEKLPGREQEVSLINEWRRDPSSGKSRAFFEYAVVQPVNTLASLGREVLRLEFEAPK